LIFVSLQMIRDAAKPLIGHAGIGAALDYLGRDAASAFLIGALLA
jgi:Na+/phosphate symporter